jgi:cobalamin biosynthesis protein CobT
MKNGQMMSLNQLSLLVRRHLSRSKTQEHSSQANDEKEEKEEENSNETSLETENETEDEDDDDAQQPENNSYDSDEDDEQSEVLSNVKNHNVRGMRLFESIKAEHANAYFLININDHDMYIHKQAAAWLLSKDRTTLSSDRLKRVQNK